MLFLNKALRKFVGLLYLNPVLIIFARKCTTPNNNIY